MSGGLDAAAVGALVALAGAVLAVSVLAAVVLSRRKLRRETRELVAALESMRGGRPRHHADVPSDSPLALLADAVHRLSQDLTVRWHDAERMRTQVDALLSAAPDTAIVSADDEGVVRSFNEVAETTFGWSAEDIRGQSAALLFPDDAWKDLLAKLLRREVRARGLRLRSRMRRRDDTTFEAELFVRPLERGEGVPSGFLVAVRDVDPAVRLERRLEDARRRYEELLDRVGDGVVVLVDGRIVRSNPPAEGLLERDAAALAGQAFHDLVPTRDVLRLRDWLETADPDAALETAVVVGAFERRVRLRVLSAERDGRPARVVVLEDVGALASMQAELRRNEERLDAVLEAASDGLLVLASRPGQRGAIVSVTNRAFLELFGLRAEEVLGASEETLLRLLGDRGAAAVATLLAVPREETVRSEVRLPGDPGREIEIHGAPLRDRAGRIAGRLVSFRDRSAERAPERRLEAQAEELEDSVAELRRTHAALEDRTRELDERAERAESLVAELRKLNEMKSQLLANVAHDLQVPLVAIRGYSEMIVKGRLGPVTEEQRRGLDLALRNVDRLISLIDGLLEFSRMEQQAGRLRLVDFDLGGLIEECREVLQPRMDERRIRWSATIEPAGLRVRADRDKIRQVVLNLTSNAVKFNRDGGLVEIVARLRDASFASVHVRDTGRGIPKDDLERIFDRFYRGDDAREAAEGTGLGLPIVRNLLRLHGCSIQAESKPGEGATFTFTLPVAEAEAGDPPRATEEPAAPDTPASADETPVDRDEPHGSERTESSAPRGDGRPRLRIIRR